MTSFPLDVNDVQMMPPAQINNYFSSDHYHETVGDVSVHLAADLWSDELLHLQQMRMKHGISIHSNMF